MRPFPRQQHPTPFARRWPRARRIATQKGVPEIKRHRFEYDAEIVSLDAVFHHDLRQVFPVGECHVKRTFNWKSDCVVFDVTQTKAQRFMKP